MTWSCAEQSWPHLSFTSKHADNLRQQRQATVDAFDTSITLPFSAQPKTVKNVSYNTFGAKLGRVHMKRQNLSKLGTFKAKGLKRTHNEKENSRTVKKSKVEVE